MALSDSEIIARIDAEEATSYGINDSSLSNDRAQAIDYYLGEPFGNEEDGRSQVISYDVQDTVESALPQLLKVFVSGDKVVEFAPRSAEDEDGAAQETDYINHIVMEKNDGYKVFYVWFKDALLSKNGYVKAYYEEENEVEEEEYQGLTDAQLSMVLQNPNVELLEINTYADPAFDPQQAIANAMQTGEELPPEPQLHDIKIRVTETKGEIKIQNVAPENIMVSIDTSSPSLNHSRFVQHREIMDVNEVSEQFGLTVAKIEDIMSDTNDRYETESIARDIYNEQFNMFRENQMILVKDTYLMVDGERKRYVIIGNQIIYKSECEAMPFACITPMIMPHRHIGRSYADLTKDIQLTKSTLLRGQLDNMYLANNGRYAISDRVNLSDMLTSRAGGVVRVQGDPMSAIMPLSHPPLPQASFTMIEYMDSMKEKRTGITAYNQGLDSNSLNKTASGMAQVMSAAQQRVELVARTFAETGVKDLFMLVHKLVRTHVNKADTVRLRNKWVDVDPRDWKNRKDLVISVGLGAGNKDQQLMHLNNILTMQKEALQIGVTSPDKIYNALAKLTQNAGFKNPEEFWTNPQDNPPQEPQPSDVDKQIQATLQIEQIKAEDRQQKFQAEVAIEQEKAKQDLIQEQVRSENDVQIEKEKIASQMELERFKAELNAQVELEKATMQVQAQQAMKEMEYNNAQQQSSQPSVTIQQPDSSALLEALNTVLQNHQVQNEELIRTLTRPKRIVRDENGRALGVE